MYTRDEIKEVMERTGTHGSPMDKWDIDDLMHTMKARRIVFMARFSKAWEVWK